MLLSSIPPPRPVRPAAARRLEGNNLRAGVQQLWPVQRLTTRERTGAILADVTAERFENLVFGDDADDLFHNLTILPLHDPPGTSIYSCSVKVPQRWQRNERSHWEYRRLWVT